MLARIRLERVAALLAITAGVSCGRGSGGSSDREGHQRNAPRPGEAQADAPHVVFTRQELVITRLGVPVSLPVTVPSRPSPSTLRVADPTVVAIDENGNAVGRAAGRSRIETIAGRSFLDVRVLPARAFQIAPQRSEVPPGGSVELRLVDPASGTELPASAASWTSSAPDRVVVRDGVAYASDVPGTASIFASYGGMEARAELVVVGRRLMVVPDRTTMRVGEVRLFTLSRGAGGARTAWSSSAPRVVASVGQGMFQARRPGRASVCAMASGESACATAEVRP